MLLEKDALLRKLGFMHTSNAHTLSQMQEYYGDDGETPKVWTI